MQELSSIVRKKIIKYYCAQSITLRLLQHPRTMPTVILIMEWTLPCGQQAFLVLLGYSGELPFAPTATL